MSRQPYSGERRACRLCNQPVTFMKDVDGVIHTLDSMAPTYRLEPDMLGEEVAVATNSLVDHAAICSKYDPNKPRPIGGGI